MSDRSAKLSTGGRQDFGGAARRIEGKVVSLPGGKFCAGGKLFESRDEAIAAARKLDVE